MRAANARPSDVMGVPRLPPPAAIGPVERLRHSLGRLHRGSAPPPVQIIEGVLGVLDYVALGALCAIDIPDRVERPIALRDLAARCNAPADTVERLVRYAATRGWIRLDRHGRARPTRVTRFLRRDHPGGWRAWVDFACSEEVAGALARLATDPRAHDPFAAANGVPFFEWYSAHPDRHAAFDGAMAAGARLHGLALSAALDWSTTRRVCDVGGGTGALLGVLLDAHPHLEGVLADLPQVVERAARRERLEVVGGDAFVAVPPDCDAYLFVNVLHDWDDAACVTLLSNALAAGAAGARFVVVEGEPRARPVDTIALRTDLLMLALTPGGQERTAEEFAQLARSAGAVLTSSVALASGDRAHVMKAS